MNIDDVLAGLPAPRDDEPASLRRDIADELADHLACAYRRELLVTGDEQRAQQQVLERFGDPRRIARQLWWQAMWSRIMLQRFALGLQTVLVAGLILVAYQLSRVMVYQAAQTQEWNSFRVQQQANQAMLQQLLQRLPPPEQAHDGGGEMAAGMGAFGGPALGAGFGGTDAAGAGGMLPGSETPAAGPWLELHVVLNHDDGPPAEGCLVAVTDEDGNSLAWRPLFGAAAAFLPGGGFADAAGGMAMSGGMGMLPGGFGGAEKLPQADAHGVRLRPEWKGSLRFGPVEPGRYMAYVAFPDGRWCQKRLVVKQRETTHALIVCPPPSGKSFVTITAPPLPEGLVGAEFTVRLTSQSIRLGERDPVDWQWLPPVNKYVEFDRQTRLVRVISTFFPRQHVVAFQDEPASDRFLVLPEGSYLLEVQLRRDAVPNVQQLLATFTVTQVVTPGDNAWQLEIPAEILSEVQKRLDEERRTSQPEEPAKSLPVQP